MHKEDNYDPAHLVICYCDAEALFNTPLEPFATRWAACYEMGFTDRSRVAGLIIINHLALVWSGAGR